MFNGLYTEISPVQGRSQLNFLKGNMVVKSEPGHLTADTFHYSLLPGKIVLTPAWTTQFSAQEFNFEKIDEHTISIQSLYPGIPEAGTHLMTYKR